MEALLLQARPSLTPDQVRDVLQVTAVPMADESTAGSKLRLELLFPYVNSTYAILRAVQSGLGLASLPEFMTLESSALVRVLPELQGPRIDAYFVYPEELRNSKRIQVFRDFLLRKVAESKMTA